MAKPYLIFKAHTGIYYAQIRLADGSLSSNKSTGCRNRTEAERIHKETANGKKHFFGTAS